MFRWLSRILVLVAAVQLLGGHWAVLQSVAWAGMVLKYAQQESISSALDKTFSGENPCSLCEVVRSGKESEEKQVSVKTLVKLEAILAPKVAAPAPQFRPRLFFAAAARVAPPFFGTSKRPPRLA